MLSRSAALTTAPTSTSMAALGTMASFKRWVLGPGQESIIHRCQWLALHAAGHALVQVLTDAVRAAAGSSQSVAKRPLDAQACMQQLVVPLTTAVSNAARCVGMLACFVLQHKQASLTAGASATCAWLSLNPSHVGCHSFQRDMIPLTTRRAGRLPPFQWLQGMLCLKHRWLPLFQGTIWQQPRLCHSVRHHIRRTLDCHRRLPESRPPRGRRCRQGHRRSRRCAQSRVRCCSKGREGHL